MYSDRDFCTCGHEYGDHMFEYDAATEEILATYCIGTSKLPQSDPNVRVNDGRLDYDGTKLKMTVECKCHDFKKLEK